MHEKKGIFLFPWCTGTGNTLGQFFLTLGIHLITMVGQNIHRRAAIHGGGEALLAWVWTHFESFVRQAIVSHSATFSTCMFLHVSSAHMCLLQ